ncbi:ABC transporter ATP-binding protein [Hafnia psychrotolerans]|uniref:ABC transporter ATP-binding protein n=1 Tax=Hafnia psychrotolerans TaxID=1477018 RepID=A0ABQ1G022_9GAMM|nr:ABC transporter ATP-binding protein [Hafnia psychrotolerans]GGA34822.1 ABC transporter ATP-binding protein [Hafnia psychrotolerans]
MKSIIVNNVSKAYKQYSSKWNRFVEKVMPGNIVLHKKKWVLDDICFEIEAGDSVGIIGVNGAGKSTLLKLLTGTTKPTKGDITVNGKVAALLELGMGFHPDFTGRQNVYMSGLLMGYKRYEIEELFLEIENFAEIGDYIDQPVRIYSSGMQMRLAFAVATATRPDILIVDEALTVGDAKFQAKCFQRIAAYRKAGTTLLLVSHGAEDIVKHCNNAIFLKNGRIEAQGPSRSVTNIYLDELFGKSKTKSSKSERVEAKNSSLTELASSENTDIFCTRPGYRKEEHRWGHGGATILDYEIKADHVSYPSRIESNQHTDFYMKVRFDEDFDSVIPGFLIKSLEGIFLYGTNSYLASQGKQNIEVKAGDVKIFKFSFPVNLNQGNYLVSFGISSGTPPMELKPLERRYDAIIINVSRQMAFWGIIDCQSEFDVVV